MPRSKNKYRKYLFLSFVFIILVFITFFSGYFIFRDKRAVADSKNDILIKQENNGQEKKIYRTLDGIEAQSEEAVNPFVAAVVIDNFIDSRPLSGLSEANLVYEILSEAGITRFLAFYADSDQEIRKIGPVRSARPYFLDLAEEYNALFMHVGGSPAALASLKSDEYNIKNLDQFFNAKYFWREKLRKAPFNVYTSSDLFQRVLRQNEEKPKEIDVWQFKDDLPSTDRLTEGKDVIIDYSYPEYKVKWTYDRESNDYLREEGGKLYLEEGEKQIRAKNIIIQVVETIILDEEGRKEIKTRGEGGATIFQDGKAIKGFWQKFRKGQRTRFFDQDNNEIRLNRGKIWIEMVSNEGIVSY